MSYAEHSMWPKCILLQEQEKQGELSQPSDTHQQNEQGAEMHGQDGSSSTHGGLYWILFYHTTV